VWCSAVQLALEADFLDLCSLKDHGGGMILYYSNILLYLDNIYIGTTI